MNERDEQSDVPCGDGADGITSMLRFAARMSELLREDAELRRAALGFAGWLQSACGAEPSVTPAAKSTTPATGTEFGAGATIAEDVERREVTLNIGGQQVRVDAIGDGDVEDLQESTAELQPVPAPSIIQLDHDLDAAPRVPPPYVPDLTKCARFAERAGLDLERLAAEPSAERRADVAEELSAEWRDAGRDFWALNASVEWPGADDLRDLCELYANLAGAARAADEIRNDEEYGAPLCERAYTLLAESQSALRIALEEWIGVRRDSVQGDAFRWLDVRTRIDRIFVSRHMRLDDAGDPRGWVETRERLDRLNADWRSGGARKREQRSLANKVSYHLQRIARDAAHGPVTTEWERVNDVITQLLDAGTPPSNRELRDELIPLVDSMPDDFEPGEAFARVLEELDRFLTEREEREATAPRTETRERNEDVLQVAEMLRGREMVLIGGDERLASKAALVRDFELADLQWVATRAHQSYSAFESSVARPETAVVVLAIRWSSHSFDNVKALCEKYGKPYVRLPGGYNPNQVARQVLEQASAQLGG